MIKHCLFCKYKEDLAPLYHRNFTDIDLTPEVFSARRFSDRFHYEIVRCKNCGLTFSREVLPDNILANLYSGSRVTFENFTDRIRQDYARPLKPYLSKIAKGSALEIGCSSGFFLEKLLALGFKRVYGCEPSLEAKEKALPSVRDSIMTRFFGRGVFPDNSLDLICSFQTLDHLNEPAETVKICHDNLKPGGYAYFITHDAESWSARLLKERSPIIDVEHIYLFNKKTLRRVFQEAGFEVLTVADLKNTYPLGYWLELLLKNSLAGKLAKGLVKVSGFSPAIPIAAGNIYIIARRAT